MSKEKTEFTDDELDKAILAAVRGARYHSPGDLLKRILRVNSTKQLSNTRRLGPRIYALRDRGKLTIDNHGVISGK